MSTQSKDLQRTLIRLGEDIREKRKRLGITQSEMALQLDMNVSNYNTIEKGKANVTIATLKKVYNTLGYDLNPKAFSVERFSKI